MKSILIIGMGRFGKHLCTNLARLGNQIMAVDENEETRVTFNEITKDAVKNGINNPRKIDLNLTNEQQARRVLDRIVGYKISPVLWKKVKRGLSAGRVQSVAVKLIVEREEEIESFVPEEYWNINLTVSDKKTKTPFECKFVGKNGKKIELHSKEEVDKILKDLENEINSIYETFNCYLSTIPGISNILAAIILSEIGDINKFSSPAKLVAFSGIDPSVNQSGEFVGTENTLSKRGSPFLRRALFLAAFVAENNNSTLKDYYQKKIKEGKHHYVATRCCC